MHDHANQGDGPAELEVWQSRTRWADVGPPLRPGPADVAMFQRLADEALAGKGGAAVLLGVTPEIVRMRWPAGAQLIAVDFSPEMIERVWPGPTLEIAAKAHLGDWRDLPVETASTDLVVGDGCLSALLTSDCYERTCSHVARALKPGGRFIIRLFVRPERQESPEAVLSDLAAGRIGNFHIFKWRLAMAMPTGPEFDVRVGDIWEEWTRARIDRNALAAQMQWPLAAIETIEDYRGSDTRFTFPPFAEVLRRIEIHFDVVSTAVPDYEIGERCPTLLLAPRPRR